MNPNLTVGEAIHNMWDNDDEPPCNVEHPRLAGNHCILFDGHYQLLGSPHEDADGNEWRGMPLLSDC